MKCLRCPRRLTDADVMKRFRTCRTCRAIGRTAKKGHGFGKRKPKTHQHITVRARSRYAEMLKGSGDSWWADFATGDRRDGDYMAEAERRWPTEKPPMLLKPWTGAA